MWNGCWATMILTSPLMPPGDLQWIYFQRDLMLKQIIISTGSDTDGALDRICLTHCGLVRDHSGHGLSQWEMMFHHNINCHWLKPYTEWSLTNDAKWQHRSRSTLVQVMACCLMAPSHYMNQCWLIISEVLWHSLESNFNIQSVS